MLPRVRREDGKARADSHKRDRWPRWAPREASVDMGGVLGMVARQAEMAVGRAGPWATPTWPCPSPAPPPVPHTPTEGRGLPWLLTPLLASADEECIRLFENSRSSPGVSDLASTQPPSGNAHGGSRAADGARGQRLTGAPPALPHQCIGPRRVRRVCMDCSAPNLPPGKHPKTLLGSQSLWDLARLRWTPMDRYWDHGTSSDSLQYWTLRA